MAVSFGPMTIIWLAVKTLGSLFVMACALRAYLQAVRLHSQNPLSRLTFQMTDWVVLPIRRLVPGFGGVDWASVLASLLISIALVTIFYLLTVWGLLQDSSGSMGKPVRPFGWLVLLAALWASKWCLQLAVVILIANALMSWINPMHPMKPVLELLASPMLKPFRRLMGRNDSLEHTKVSSIGRRHQGRGFDLTPIAAFLVLQILAAVVTELETVVIRHLF